MRFLVPADQAAGRVRQTRIATQLPVLTMITGYAGWASGLLVPTRRAEDSYAGWWRLLEQLGAVPRVPVWDGEAPVGRWRPASRN
jgi:hypothetical protein